MNINVSIIEKVVNKEVKDILDQLRGNLYPPLTIKEAINKLGAISGLIITLRDEARDAGLSEDLLDKIWMLKKESDENLESLFDELNKPKLSDSQQKMVQKWFEEESEAREQKRVETKKERMKLYKRRD